MAGLPRVGPPEPDDLPVGSTSRVEVTAPHGLGERLADVRGGRVVFLSHCLLNENVRYLGGAARPGAVVEISELLGRSGVGMVQMPCPEERAWGGVLKSRLVRGYGAGQRWWSPLRGLAFRVGLAWTRQVYRRLARQLARQVRDYQRAGMEVVAIVGVGASPSCGVLSTLDLRAAGETLAGIDPSKVTRADFNRDVVASHVVTGRGLFMAELEARLARCRVTVPLLEHDLVAELAGTRSNVVSELARRCGSPV